MINRSCTGKIMCKCIHVYVVFPLTIVNCKVSAMEVIPKVLAYYCLNSYNDTLIKHTRVILGIHCVLDHN